MITDTVTFDYYQLPDGTAAIVRHEMTYGEAVIILLLVFLVLIQVYALWTRQRSTR
jgi:hypothetical protein